MIIYILHYFLCFLYSASLIKSENVHDDMWSGKHKWPLRQVFIGSRTNWNETWSENITAIQTWKFQIHCKFDSYSRILICWLNCCFYFVVGLLVTEWTERVSFSWKYRARKWLWAICAQMLSLTFPKPKELVPQSFALHSTLGRSRTYWQNSSNVGRCKLKKRRHQMIEWQEHKKVSETLWLFAFKSRNRATFNFFTFQATFFRSFTLRQLWRSFNMQYSSFEPKKLYASSKFISDTVLKA